MHLRPHVRPRPSTPSDASRPTREGLRAGRAAPHHQRETAVTASSIPLQRMDNSRAHAAAPSLRLGTVWIGPQPVQPAANAPLAIAPMASADTAIDVLAAQIHALLGALIPLEKDDFRQAARRFDASRADTLTRPALAYLLRALKALPPATALPPRQEFLRAALRDVTRAADAELLLQEQIARHGRRQLANALPGSQTGTDTRARVGVAFGIPGACTADVAVEAGAQTSIATGEDLTVATVRTHTVQGDVVVQAGVAPGVGVDAMASGYYSHGRADITASMRTHVLALAHASVARRLGGNRLARAARQLFGTNRDRYAERASRALAWQPRLQMLQVVPASIAARASLPFATRAGAPIQATATTVGASLAAGAGAGIGRLSLSGELMRSTFVAALPTRLTTLDDSGASPTGRAEIRAALAQRIAPLLDDTGLHSPTLQQVRVLRAAAGGDADLVARRAAVDQLRSEFDHLEALVRHTLVAPHHAVQVLGSLCRDWGSAAAACEPVMIGMLDTLAWLQAAPKPPQRNVAHLARWSALQEDVAALAGRIHDTQLPHDRTRVHLATHGFRDMTQRVTNQRGTLTVSAAAMPGRVAATVSVARHVREDPDPMRAGTYLEVGVRMDASASIGALLAELQRQWPQGWESLPAQELENVLSSVSPMLTASANVHCLVRLFRPDFQRDPAFPEAARGTHLQTVRLSTGTTRAFGMKLPLPLLPGAAPTLGVSHRRSSQHTRAERLCDTTLTGTLLRYQSLCTKSRSNADTWTVLLQSHGADLDRLCQALAQPGSVPAQEARYWLQQGGAGPEALDAVVKASDDDARRARLFQLFDALGTGTAQHKAASPLLGALALPQGNSRRLLHCPSASIS